MNAATTATATCIRTPHVLTLVTPSGRRPPSLSGPSPGFISNPLIDTLSALPKCFPPRALRVPRPVPSLHLTGEHHAYARRRFCFSTLTCARKHHPLSLSSPEPSRSARKSAGHLGRQGLQHDLAS